MAGKAKNKLVTGHKDVEVHDVHEARNPITVGCLTRLDVLPIRGSDLQVGEFLDSDEGGNPPDMDEPEMREMRTPSPRDNTAGIIGGKI